MVKSTRGKSPGTRKAVAASNLRRKVDRLRDELGTIAKDESDRLLAQSSIALQVLFLLQEISAQDGEFADRSDELTKELQAFLVEQSYQESVADGVVITPSGSWIV